MKNFMSMPVEVLDALSQNDMVLVLGGKDDASGDTINNSAGCGCTNSQN